MNRRTFCKRSLLASPVAFAAGAGYGRYIERHEVEVVHQDIEIGIGEPLTVALLADIHFDPLCEIDYLEKVVALVNELAPDLIVYAGDFFSSSASRIADLLGVLRKAEASAGSFAVLGNHDQGLQPDWLSFAFASAGISILRNRSIPLPGREHWFLTGLESYWRGAPNVKSLAATPSDARHIMLVHEPDAFDLLTDRRIALQLSGHTHGGQVCLPLVGAICLPRWGKKYPAGLYERDGRHLYVNRGIGTVKKHYRMNCRPEITFLKLT